MEDRDFEEESSPFLFIVTILVGILFIVYVIYNLLNMN